MMVHTNSRDNIRCTFPWSLAAGTYYELASTARVGYYPWTHVVMGL